MRLHAAGLLLVVYYLAIPWHSLLAWGVDFSIGVVRNDTKSGTPYVRAVRGGS